MNIFGSVVNAVSSVGKQYLENKAQKNKLTADLQKAKVDAQIRRLENEQNIEADYDLEALRQTQYSWKDEVALIVILLPFIGSFLPQTQEYVAIGWQHLQQHAPDWYTYAFLGAIGASMGIRWAVTSFGKNK